MRFKNNQCKCVVVLAGQNVSQRAPHVVFERVVLCVVVYDTFNTFLFRVRRQ